MTTRTRQTRQAAATLFDRVGGLPRPQPPAPRPQAPAIAGLTWLAFSLDHSEDDAARCFQQRYGKPPRYITENLGLLLVGPIPSEVQS